MSKKFIAFKPLTGIYKETMEPYQRMTEKGEMSPLLEIDRNYYRILRTTLDGLMPRKMVVCREDGQIVESEEITFKSTQGGKERHESLIQAFQIMVTDLTLILSADEQKAMEFHLHYLKEIYRLSVLITDLASELITYWKQIEKTKVDKLSSKQIAEIRDMVMKRRRLTDQFEGILFEDGERALSTVQMIIKKRKYKSQISNQIDLNKVLKEIKGARGATKRYLRNFKEDY